MLPWMFGLVFLALVTSPVINMAQQDNFKRLRLRGSFTWEKPTAFCFILDFWTRTWVWVNYNYLRVLPHWNHWLIRENIHFYGQNIQVSENYWNIAYNLPRWVVSTFLGRMMVHHGRSSRWFTWLRIKSASTAARPPVERRICWHRFFELFQPRNRGPLDDLLMILLAFFWSLALCTSTMIVYLWLSMIWLVVWNIFYFPISWE